MSDLELLQQYARENSQPAFATLVRRYLDLVYSAAHRQVRSTQLAEEVAQSVFIDLARHAAKIRPDQPLAAWLFVVTRRTAVDTLRRESRRQIREQTAAAIAAMKTPSHSWSQVREVVDESMAALSDAERTAILLRFFENRSLREVGASLGISEDTAQKRVSRALDHLHDLLLRRGVAVSSSALATELSTHAIEAAPAALGATITSAAGAVSLSGAAAEVIVMTTTQKAFVAAAFALTVGGALFEAQTLFSQRDEIAHLQQSNDALAAGIRQLQKQNAIAARTAVAAAPAEAAPAVTVDPALASEANAWLDRLQLLQKLAAGHPEWTIPEMALLEEKDWFERARRHQVDRDPNFATSESLLGLRGLSKARFATRLSEAAREYVKAHDGRLPASTRELAPYFKIAGVTEAMLDRYAVRYSGVYADLPAELRGATFVEITSPDEERDQRTLSGPGGVSLRNFRDLRDDTTHALKAFAQANGGAAPTNSGDLLPYFNPPLSPARRLKFIETGTTLFPRR